MPCFWLAPPRPACALSALAAPSVPAIAPRSCPPAGRPLPPVTLAPACSSLGPLANGVPVPVVAMLPFFCVCLPHYSCAPPSYLNMPWSSRNVVVPLRQPMPSFSTGSSSRRSLFGPGDQSGPSDQSRPNTPPVPCVSVSNTPFFTLCVSFSDLRTLAKRGALCLSRGVLAQCRAVQFPPKGCSKRLNCRIRSAPPPLMPEKATSA